MKKLLITLIGAFIFTSAYAIKVKTEVFEVEYDDDGICCYKMIHLFYTDDDIFIGYGLSNSGDCCPGSRFEVDPNGLDATQIAELKAFALTGTFSNSQQDAIAVYIAGNGIGYIELKVSPSTKRGKIALDFNANQQGIGSLTIVPMTGGNILQQKVDVRSGENSLEIKYNLNISGYGPDFYMVTLVLEEEVFRTVANLN